MTFRSRILISFTLLVSMISATVIGYFYYTETKQAQKTAVREISANTDRVMSDLVHFAHERQNDLEAMATARVWYDRSAPVYVTKRLQIYRDIYQGSDRVTLFSLQGRVLADSDDKNIGGTEPVSDWEKVTTGSDGIDVTFDQENREGVLHFYREIRNLHAERTAIISCQVPFSRVSALIRGFSHSPEESSPLVVQLMDGNGRLLFASAKTAGLNRVVPAWDRIRKERDRLIAARKLSATLFDKDRITIIALSSDQYNLPWLLRVEIPKSLLFAEATSRGKELALCALLLTCCAGLIIWFMAARLSQPVEELALQATALGKGEFAGARELPARNDEFGILVESMRGMATRLEESLTETRKSEARLRALVDAIPDLVFRNGSDGTFLEVIGLPAGSHPLLVTDPVGKGYYQVLPEAIARIFSDNTAGALATGEQQNFDYALEENGTMRHFSAHMVRIGDNEVLTTVRDITGRKSIEDALRSLNEELEERVGRRTAELESSNRELAGFCYAISHELRAPLARLSGFSTMLEEEAERGDITAVRHHATRVSDASRQLQSVIDGLLLLSRLSRTEPDRCQFDLSVLASEIAEPLAAAETRRRIIFRIEPGLQVNGDRTLLRTCLQHLFDNAFRFTRDREQALIEFGRSNHNGTPAYYVRDNGTGFDMAFAHRLFTPFQRLHSDLEHGGTGLGLAVAQRIIQRHGGTIWSEAAPDGGATFSFTLGAVPDLDRPLT